MLDRVRSCLPSDQIFQNTSVYRNYREQKQDFLYIREKERLRFVWGHLIHEEMLKFFGTNAILVTGLRDPIERFKSELNYAARLANHLSNSRPDIEAIIKKTRNPICWFLIRRFPTIAGEAGSPADRAMNVIDACHYVYFSENFDDTAGAIFKAMGINPKPLRSNVAPDRKSEVFDIDVKRFTYDIELYERARQKFSDMSPEKAFSRASPGLTKLLSTPLNEKVLRDFLYDTAFYEYKNWNVLTQVLAYKKSQVDELNYEIDCYEKMRSRQRQTD